MIKLAELFGCNIFVILILHTLNTCPLIANPDDLIPFTHSDYDERYKLLIENYDYYFELNRDSALVKLESIITKSTEKAEIAESYYLLGSLYSFSPESDSAKIYLNKALKLSKEINYKQIKFRSLNHLGMVYAIAQKNSESLYYFSSAYQDAETLKDTTMITMVTNNIAIIHGRLELYEEALKWHNKSRQLLELKGLQNEADSSRMRSHLTNMGVLYEKLNMDQKAIDIWYEALKYSKNGTCALFTNLSTGYNKLKRYDKALEYADKAIELANINSEITISNQIHSIEAKMYALKDLNRNGEALKNAHKALAIVKKHQLNDDLINIYNFVGEIFIDRNESDSALTYFNSALELLKETENLDIKATTLKNFSELYELIGEDSRALNFLKDYISVSDSIVQQEKENQTERIKVLINYKDIENENQQLKLENQLTIVQMSKEKNLRVALIIIIALIFVLIIFIYRVYSIKKNQAKKLELLVDEKTRELRNEIQEKSLLNYQLGIEKERAEQANKLKTEFLAQMSHEIRTPLYVMNSFSSLLKDEFLPQQLEDNKDIFLGIETANKRIIRTVDLILNMSEIQTGSYDPVIKEINLNEILSNLQREYSKFATDKKMQLIFSPTNICEKILGDEYSVTQIFANLIDNAIKYSESGYVEINCSPNSSGNVMVNVKDTGIGISEEYLVNIFEPFSQEDSGYSRDFDGNGLGLALVKKYCDVNNAEITVESKKGIGSTFSVTFKGIKHG